MVLKKIRNRPSSIPWLLFGLGIIFFAIAGLYPKPSETVDPNFIVGVLFFGSGIVVGFTQALKRKRRQ